MNVMIAGMNTSWAQGTIGANGTASEIFDLGTYSLMGLVCDNLTNGTMSFQVASYNPAAPATDANIGTLRTLLNWDGSTYSSGAVSGNVAFTLDAIRVLAPYRYVRVIMSIAQANTPTIRFILKA